MVGRSYEGRQIVRLEKVVPVGVRFCRFALLNAGNPEYHLSPNKVQIPGQLNMLSKNREVCRRLPTSMFAHACPLSLVAGYARSSVGAQPGERRWLNIDVEPPLSSPIPRSLHNCSGFRKDEKQKTALWRLLFYTYYSFPDFLNASTILSIFPSIMDSMSCQLLLMR